MTTLAYLQVMDTYLVVNLSAFGVHEQQGESVASCHSIRQGNRELSSVLALSKENENRLVLYEF
jgi:hypothetical protein